MLVEYLKPADGIPALGRKVLRIAKFTIQRSPGVPDCMLPVR